MIRRGRWAAAASLALGAALGLRAAEEIPDWVTEARTRTVPQYEGKVPGVYLLREDLVTIEENGRITSTVRTVYRVLTNEGRPEAYRNEFYEAGTSKVREIKAWMFGSTGEQLKLGKENEFDRAYASNDVYDNIRVRGIDGRSKADPGSVMAVQFVLEDKVLFNQLNWYFQRQYPTLISRLVLTLPAGWSAASTTLNHSVIEPSVAGTSYTWAASQLPFLPNEPGSPKWYALAPRMAISYYPREGLTAFPGKAFPKWQDVSAWASVNVDPQAEPDEEVTAKAKALTANSKTDWERARAIARYVQSTKYVAIEVGLGRGAGYRPRPAGEVLEKEYGDCKDKATLMRALLKAAGIKSYLVLLHGNDRSFVHEEWPSPGQFNHAIVAMRLDASNSNHPMVELPGLGRFMLFDPTSGSNPLGSLPVSEQGGLALVAAGANGALVRLPFETSESYVDRELTASLDQTGALTAKFSDKASGANAARDRGLLYSRGPEEFRKMLERWISGFAPGAQVDKIEQRDHFDDGQFDVHGEFRVPFYGQMRANKLMIFKPVVVGRRQGVFLTEKNRTEPVLLEPSQFRETAHIRLPENFKVDEMPDAENFETPFGKYSASFESKDGEIVFHRMYEIHPATVPVGEYQALRGFFERILSVEQTPVVLVKQ